MKHISNPAIPFLLLAVAAMTQFSLSAPAPLPAELGTWWRDSEVVRGLQLRESQIKQIDQAFLSHRSDLNNLAAELQRQEAILQSLIDTSRLDAKKAAAQIDQVVTARARLEKEKTMMALDIRLAVSFDQWRKLQEMQRSQANAAPAPAAAKPAPKADGSVSISEEPIYQIGGPVTDPVPVQRPTPAFTAQARERKVEGSVLLAVVIGKDGAVRNVKVLRGLGYGLDESAADTVTKRWLFKPSTLNGQPVSVQAMIEVTFHLYQQ
ncbi:MAG: TonB family protein [Acidobacteriia bacterium]|nr:TonB family protein [Terriglobia bacterium]